MPKPSDWAVLISAGALVVVVVLAIARAVVRLVDAIRRLR